MSSSFKYIYIYKNIFFQLSQCNYWFNKQCNNAKNTVQKKMTKVNFSPIVKIHFTLYSVDKIQTCILLSNVSFSYEDDCLLGYCAIQCGRKWPFPRCLLPPLSGSKHLWNVGQFLPDFTVHYPRRQSSLYMSPWEPEISLYYSVVFRLRWITQEDLL
jgi:hypothetical protein